MSFQKGWFFYMKNQIFQYDIFIKKQCCFMSSLKKKKICLRKSVL